MVKWIIKYYIVQAHLINNQWSAIINSIGSFNNGMINFNGKMS